MNIHVFVYVNLYDAYVYTYTYTIQANQVDILHNMHKRE